MCYWYKFSLRAVRKRDRGRAKLIPIALYLFYSGLTIEFLSSLYKIDST